MGGYSFGHEGRSVDASTAPLGCCEKKEVKSFQLERAEQKICSMVMYCCNASALSLVSVLQTLANPLLSFLFCFGCFWNIVEVSELVF